MYRIAVMLIGLVVCLLPSFIAIYRDKRRKNAIIVFNLLFGALLAGWVALRVWGLLGAGLAGWVAVMVWSLWPESPRQELTGPPSDFGKTDSQEGNK